MSDDYQLWSISASEYVDEIIWIVQLQATWAFKDKTEGFSTCYNLFEWLDIVHTEWTTIPTHQIYDIMHKCYLKSLPTDIMPPPSLSTLLNPLTPVPLGFIHPTSPPHVTSPSNQQPTDKGDASQLHPKHCHHHGHKKCWSEHISECMAGILPSHIPLPSFANTCSISMTLMSGIGLNIFVTPSLCYDLCKQEWEQDAAEPHWG